MISCLNGEFRFIDDCTIPINDRGLLIGDGLFETLYYNGHKLECFTAHYQRLRQGLTLFQIPWHYSESHLEKMILDLLMVNQLTLETAAIRLTLTRGKGIRGLAIPESCNPTFFMQCFPYKRESKRLKLAISNHLHPGPSALTTVKHLGYQLSILGRLEAEQKGVNDVLFLNARDEAVCSTTSNIFAIIDDVIITPPLVSGCLPGIKRGQIIQTLKSNGKAISIRSLTKLDILQKADGIFLTNSLIDKQWVESVQGRNLKNLMPCY